MWIVAIPLTALLVLIIAPVWLALHSGAKAGAELLDDDDFAVPETPRRNPYWRRRALLKARRRK